ncbi:hypothetical protein LCGC14_2621050, partial [marine sediment metagenome]
MAQIKNAFSAGMDKDSSKNKYDNTHYFDANNIRIITQDGLSSGAIENVKGNRVRVVGDERYILGGCVLRDYVVLWTTNTLQSGEPSSSTVCTIHAVLISDLNALTGTDTITLDDTYLHNGGNLIYTGFLRLGIKYPLKAIGRYENENVQKVDWVDSFNKLKHLNIIHNADTNDLE